MDGDYNDKGEKIMVRDDEGTVAAQEKAKTDSNQIP